MLRITLPTLLLLLLATATTAQIRSARVISENTKLRETPSFSSLTEGDIPEGSIVKVLDEKTPWFVIRVGDRVGWIHGGTLQFVSDDSGNGPLVIPQSTPPRNEANPSSDSTQRTKSKTASTTPAPVRQSTERKDIYIRGPRGGCYYISGSGRKVYVDRSMCN